MRLHTITSMRDHLLALQEIDVALSQNAFDKAATIAEQRLGMSSLELHGAAHIAPFMPQGMQESGRRCTGRPAALRSKRRPPVLATMSGRTRGARHRHAAMRGLPRQPIDCIDPGVDASAYDAWYHTPRRHLDRRHRIRAVARLLQPEAGESLLDIGCGTGYFTRRFAGESSLRVVGLDPDNSALDYAREAGHWDRGILRRHRSIPAVW